MSAPWSDPVQRAACRGQLARELVLRLVFHDVRNPMTPIVGALELMKLDGVRVPTYLEKSLDQLVSRLDAFESFLWTPPGDELTPLALVRGLGISVDGEGGPLPIAPLRLLSALELAAPSALRVSESTQGWRWQIVVSGLPPQAVEAAVSPQYEVLVTRLHAPDRVLGAALLRTVIRDVGGQARSVSGAPGDLALLI